MAIAQKQIPSIVRWGVGFYYVHNSAEHEQSPEAVRQWRLEGESGARLHTRGTVGFIVRRLLAGAIFRGIGNHLLNRLWYINASRGWAPGADGHGPRAGFDDTRDTSGADRFTDPYSRFAGRGSRPSYRYGGTGGGGGG